MDNHTYWKSEAERLMKEGINNIYRASSYIVYEGYLNNNYEYFTLRRAIEKAHRDGYREINCMIHTNECDALWHIVYGVK